jgi:hypothetical protein
VIMIDASSMYVRVSIRYTCISVYVSGLQATKDTL